MRSLWDLKLLLCPLRERPPCPPPAPTAATGPGGPAGQGECVCALAAVVRKF